MAANLALVAALLAVGIHLSRRAGFGVRPLVRGALGAGVALAVFAALRVAGVATAGGLFAASDLESGAAVVRAALVASLVIAAVEEMARFGAVQVWERREPGDAALTGLGFAVVEHTLFAGVGFVWFLVRLLTATTVHVALAVLLASGYTGNAARAAHSGIVAARDLACLALAVAIHTAYNLALALISP